MSERADESHLLSKEDQDTSNVTPRSNVPDSDVTGTEDVNIQSNSTGNLANIASANSAKNSTNTVADSADNTSSKHTQSSRPQSRFSTFITKTKTLLGIDEPEQTRLDEWLFIFVNVNAVLQLLADVVLEVLHITPRRIGFLALTLVNAASAAKSLVAFKQNKVRFLHEDLQILLLLEFCLVCCDVFAIFDEECQGSSFNLGTFVAARISFVVLSLANFLIVLMIIFKYQLYHLTYVSEEDPLDKAYFERQSHDIRSARQSTSQQNVETKVNNEKEP